jgi:uncharacterized protein YqgC (DUF456 family)
MLEGIAIGIGSILILLGLAGSILPVLPGPPLSFIGLFLLSLATHFSPPLTSTFVILMALVTILVTAIDHVIPLIGAKRYGASKWGVWGSVVGMMIGIFWPPIGMLVGAFIGAVVTEWLIRKKKGEALRAGWGVVIGIFWGMVLKLGVSGMMAYYFIRALW